MYILAYSLLCFNNLIPIIIQLNYHSVVYNWYDALLLGIESCEVSMREMSKQDLQLCATCVKTRLHCTYFLISRGHTRKTSYGYSKIMQQANKKQLDLSFAYSKWFVPTLPLRLENDQEITSMFLDSAHLMSRCSFKWASLILYTSPTDLNDQHSNTDCHNQIWKEPLSSAFL